MIGNHLEPFKFWCQKVLPNVYDDSLSYYEYLCKLNEYLNEVIGQINTLTDNMEDYEADLTATWLETKNYIDNYFNNLDVQQEINNKLDAMAQSGALSTLIAPFVSQEIGGVVANQIGDTVANQIGGTVANQIGSVVAEQIGEPTASATNAWLTEHVDPVGSAVIVDNSLSISGSAADALVTGFVSTSNDNETDNVYNVLSDNDFECLSNWIQGSIGSNGSLISATNRISSNFINVSAYLNLDISVENGYKVFYTTYDEDKEKIAQTSFQTDDINFIPVSEKYIRLTLATTNDDDLTPTSSSNITINGRTSVLRNVNNGNKFKKYEKNDLIVANVSTSTGDIIASTNRVVPKEKILLNKGDYVAFKNTAVGQTCTLAIYPYPSGSVLYHPTFSGDAMYVAPSDIYVIPIVAKSNNDDIALTDVTTEIYVCKSYQFDVEQGSDNRYFEKYNNPSNAPLNETGYGKFILPKYTSGNVNSSGYNVPQTIRISTTDFITPNNDLMIVLNDDDYSFEVDTFASDGTFISSKYWIVYNYLIPYTSGRKYKITIRKNSNSEISASDYSAINSVSIYEKTSINDGLHNGFDNELALNLELGTISSSGEPISATNRIRTTSFIPSDLDVLVLLTDNSIDVELEIYDKNNTFIENKGWLNNGFELSGMSGYHFKFIARKHDNSTISSVYDVANTIKVYSKTINGKYPDYWNSYLQNKVTEINNLKQSIGKTINFIHVSDLHYEDNAKHSPFLISKLCKECNINYIFNTGDNVSPTGTTKGRDTCIEYHKMIVDQYKRADIFDKYYVAMGNHDTNMQNEIDPSNFSKVIIQPSEVYQLMGASIEQHNNVVSSADGLYYYIDDSVQDVRFIVLNSNDSGTIVDTYESTRDTWGIRQTQLNFLIDALTNTPHDVVILSHIPFTSADVKNYDMVKRILEAYNNRSTFSRTNTFDLEIYNTTVSVNFSSATKKVLCAFFGHDHTDAYFYSYGIPCIKIDTDSFNDESGTTRTKGTTSEQAFNVVCIDRVARKIYCKRIGAGNDMTVNLDEA